MLDPCDTLRVEVSKNLPDSPDKFRASCNPAISVRCGDKLVQRRILKACLNYALWSCLIQLMKHSRSNGFMILPHLYFEILGPVVRKPDSAIRRNTG